MCWYFKKYTAGEHLESDLEVMHIKQKQTQKYFSPARYVTFLPLVKIHDDSYAFEGKAKVKKINYFYGV